MGLKPRTKNLKQLSGDETWEMAEDTKKSVTAIADASPMLFWAKTLEGTAYAKEADLAIEALDKAQQAFDALATKLYDDHEKSHKGKS